MLKNEKLTVSELERSLSLRAGISKGPSSFRRDIEKYLRTFREVWIGEARALVPGTESVSAPIFMAIVNPCEQLLGSLRRTKEDRAYWSRRKNPRQEMISRQTTTVAFDDEESSFMDDEDEEHESVLPILDSARSSPEVKAMIRGRKPGEVLFGFRGMLSPGPGETWTTDIRFTTFNKDWICAIEWRGAFNDPSENTTEPIILGFASRRDFYRSAMLLLSALTFPWWCFIAGSAEIYPVGRKRPPAPHLKAIEICCRRDASTDRIGDDDTETSAWAEVLPRLTDEELLKVIRKIDLSDLPGSQARWMSEHGVDVEDAVYCETSDLLATFQGSVNRNPTCRSVLYRERRQAKKSARATSTRKRRRAPKELRGR